MTPPSPLNLADMVTAELHLPLAVLLKQSQGYHDPHGILEKGPGHVDIDDHSSVARCHRIGGWASASYTQHRGATVRTW